MTKGQLRIAPMGGAVGLDYTAVARVADDLGIDTKQAGWWLLLRVAENELMRQLAPKKAPGGPPPEG